MFLAVLGIVAWLLFRKPASPLPTEIPIKITITTSREPSHADLDPDYDNWEGTFWDVTSPRSIKANLRLKYRDGAGNTTQRDVEVWKYGAWEGGAILIGHCHLRGATRTFRTDRILACTDVDTGEIINDLPAWLAANWENSPDRAIELVMEKAWDVIRVLFYVSKADGTLDQNEQHILRSAVHELATHPAMTDKLIDGFLKTMDNPSLTAFKQAFGRLVNRNDGMATKVMIWAEQIAATKNVTSTAEQDALNYLRARLSKG